MVFWKMWKYSSHLGSCRDSLMITNYTLPDCMWETFGLNWITCFFQLKYHLQIHIIISTQTYIHNSQFVYKYSHDQVILIIFSSERETEFLLLGLWDTLEFAPLWFLDFLLSYNFSHGHELSVASFSPHINMWQWKIIKAKLGSKY